MAHAGLAPSHDVTKLADLADVRLSDMDAAGVRSYADAMAEDPSRRRMEEPRTTSAR
jgi:hypothetical protein